MNFLLLRLLKMLFLFLIAGNSIAQISLNQPIPLDPNVRVGKLSNGLTYYIQKNSKPEKKVELRLVVNAGSILEDEDQRGLAHFMEHMNFNGSKNFPKNELVNYLQKIGVQFGADLNAYTGFDETVYILPISTEDPEIVEKGFTVLEDWAGNNLMDKAEIEKERGVVLEESRLSKGASERMMRQYFPKLFNGSKYARRLPIGTEQVLKTFKPATLERFYRQWYRPDLMAVVVVGDIDPAVAEQKIRSHFSGFKNPANKKPRPVVTPILQRTKPEALVITDDEETNAVVQIFNFIRPAKQVKTWGDYRSSIVNELVTSLIGQRLQELTTKENPPFLFAMSGMQQFLRGHEVFVSYAVLGENSTQNAINALIGETERARKFGFLKTEIERAKSNLLTGAENAFKEKDKYESGRLVQGYVTHFLEKRPAPGVEARYQFLKQVLPTITENEINQAVKALPGSKNAFTLLTAPTTLKQKLPSNTQLLNQVVAAGRQQLIPYEEKAVAENLMEKGPVAGKVIDEKKNEKLGTTHLTLNNGITVTLKPTTLKNDQILMDAWRKGGVHQFTLEEKPHAQYAVEIVREMGVKDLSPEDLKKFLSGKTVQVTPYANDHEEGIEGRSSVKDFETFLQVINLYFTQPGKNAGLFKSFITKQKSQWQFLRSSPQFFFMDTAMKILYNNHPWSESLLPKTEDFDAINLNKVVDIYNRIFGNAYGMHFTFVGNMDAATAKPLLEKYLGSLPAQPKENIAKDNGARPLKGVVEANIKKGKENQSIISIVFSGETEFTPHENLVFRAMTDVLNIRIIEKLREELGGMYSGGLGGAIRKRPYVHYVLQANLPCGPENVEKLTNAFFDIVKSAQTTGVEQKDLDKVKETLKKQYQTGIQTNDFWLQSLSNAWIDETDPESVLSFEKRVDALTGDDIKKAAQKYLNLNNYFKAVLYPESSNVKDGILKKPL